MVSLSELVDAFVIKYLGYVRAISNSVYLQAKFQHLNSDVNIVGLFII